MNRGDIVYIPVKKKHSDEYKPRPVLVISNEDINSSSNYPHVIILPFTSNATAMLDIKNTDVVIDPEEYPTSNLPRKSKLETALPRYVKKSVARRFLGHLPAELMSEINSHLAYNLELLIQTVEENSVDAPEGEGSTE